MTDETPDDDALDPEIAAAFARLGPETAGAIEKVVAYFLALGDGDGDDAGPSAYEAATDRLHALAACLASIKSMDSSLRPDDQDIEAAESLMAAMRRIADAGPGGA